MDKVIAKLIDMNACQVSIDWLQTQPDLKTAWDNCPSGWLKYLLDELEFPVEDITIEYDKRVLLVCDERDIKVRPFRDEKIAQMDLIANENLPWFEYDAKITSIKAEYKVKIAPFDAECDAQIDLIADEYAAKIRSTVGFDQVVARLTEE